MTLEERKLGIINWITQIGSEKVIEKIGSPNYRLKFNKLL
jgi:hypothetical protein